MRVLARSLSGVVLAPYLAVVTAIERDKVGLYVRVRETGHKRRYHLARLHQVEVTRASQLHTDA